jgi:hypothetical protein
MTAKVQHFVIDSSDLLWSIVDVFRRVCDPDLVVMSDFRTVSRRILDTSTA